MRLSGIHLFTSWEKMPFEYMAFPSTVPVHGQVFKRHGAVVKLLL
jgi:hypothetical protein